MSDDEQSSDSSGFKDPKVSKFRVIKSKVKKALGMKEEPTINIDIKTLMRAFMQTSLYKGFSDLYPDCNILSWVFDVKDGVVIGVTLIQKKQSEIENEKK